MYAAKYDSESDRDHSTGSNGGDDGPVIALERLLPALIPTPSTARCDRIGSLALCGPQTVRLQVSRQTLCTPMSLKSLPNTGPCSWSHSEVQ
jgi:hypothetical protein